MDLHQWLQGFLEAKGSVVLADLIPCDSLVRFPEALKSVTPDVQSEIWWPVGTRTCKVRYGGQSERRGRQQFRSRDCPTGRLRTWPGGRE